MPTVDKDTFAYWVTHPEDIGEDNLPRLEATAKAFPYCQINYLMLAKVGADALSPRLTEFVPRAAAYALNRNSLRQLVEGESAWSESLLNRLSDLSLGDHSSSRTPLSRQYYRDHATPYGHGKPISLVKFEDRFKSAPEAKSSGAADEDSAMKSLPVDDTVASEREIEKELTHKKMRAESLPVIDLLPAARSLQEERRKQQEIIEAFIRNDPRIGPIRPVAEQAETQDLTQRSQAIASDGFVTESFAKIWAKQGNNDKAIAIYEKLILKNPEKSEYFAQKIAELQS